MVAPNRLRLLGNTMLGWRSQNSIRVLTVALSVILASCSPPETEPTETVSTTAGTVGPELEPRSPEAERVISEQASAFEFVRYRIEVDGDTPRLCLAFTGALDPDADYSAYVAIDPDTPLALSVNGQSLCVGGMRFDTGQSLLLREGLPSVDGERLARDETLEIEFGDRPSYVGIGGDGIILPRLEADGLAIETVNVESVQIKLWRVTDRALAFRSISAGYTAAEGDYGWLSQDERPFDVAELIWDGQMDTPGLANAATTTVFPLASVIGRLQPGAYFIEVDDSSTTGDTNRSPARTKRWLVITDLALTAYRGSDGIDYVVRSLHTASPVAGVRIELVARSNEILGVAVTDANGRARFEGPLLAGTGATAPRMLTAYGPDNDFALLDLQRNPIDLSGQDVGGRVRPDGVDGYVYLDRGIYRPGEIVEASVLLRDAAAMAVDDRRGSLILLGPNNIEADRLRFDGAPDAGGVSWTINLPSQAARGEWRLDVDVDGLGVVAQRRFSVEDFVPQRIDLDLEADIETPLLAGERREVLADVRFLYGAPGSGLPVETRLRIEKDPAPFPDYSTFDFGRHDESFREISLSLADRVADGAGRAVLTVDPGQEAHASNAPLRIRTVVSAIEPGGRPVADDVRLPYRPRDLYLGLDPLFDGRAQRRQTVSFDVVGLTALGQPGAADLSWSLVRIDWRYSWYRTDSNWRWRRSRRVVPIEEGVLTLGPNGQAQIDLSGMDWGDYQLVVASEEHGVESSAQFWVGWGARPVTGTEAPDRIRLAGPETPPDVGDTIQLSILPPYAGEAEIVIATDRVIETRSVQVPEAGTQVSFRVTEEWGAGAYAMVSVFTPRDPVDQPRPRRAVGVSYLPVNMDHRTLSLTLDAPELVRPRETLRLGIQADGVGREGAWVTVAAVDEGILALTRFASPDPHGWYFGKTALRVDLFDDYGRLLDPNQGAAAAVRQGGDQIGGAGLTVVPTRTVALYSAPVQFDSRGRAEIDFEIPDFNGELRLMAVAWSETAIGQAAQPLTVRDPVPAELILPRFLAPGDESTTTLTVDNVEGAAGQYRASISAETTVSANAEDQSDYEAGQRRDAQFAINGLDTGIGDVSLSVSGPDDFTVSRSYPIQVRSAWLPYSVVERGRVSPGENWVPDPDALTNFMPGTGEVSVSFSATPLDTAALLQSLDRYPYACTEQVTSRAMPLLYADQLAGLEDLEEIEGARHRVQEAISTLLNRMSNDGTIGLWRVGDRYASVWLAAYSIDFLSRAKEAGYAVPDAALERAYARLEHIANQEMWRARGYVSTVNGRGRWQTDTTERLSDRSSAYALYVLARAGRANRSRLRYMHDERIDSIASPLARAHIGAALYLIGDRARSRSAFDAAERVIGYRNRGDWYQTERRDLAGVLALAAEADDVSRVERLAERVALELPEPSRLTTQEKAFLLLAARSLVGDAVNMRVEGASGDGSLSADRSGQQFDFDADSLAEGARFANSGAGPVWVTQVSYGEPVSAPPAVSEGISATKRIRHLDGRDADLANLRQGDRLIIELTLNSPEPRTIPAIATDLLPAGFEIEAVLRESDSGRTGPYPWLGRLATPRVAESRDDRFVAAINLRDRGTARFAYIVRAVTPGNYAMPGVVAEDMYRPDVFARSENQRVQIAAQN
jgi:uncharacterized protein YfaS (alpha-2-macroglobulin family)